MNRTELLSLHLDMCTQARQLMEAKNTDYADKEEVFGNLDLVESLFAGKISTEEGIVIRLGDKISRLGKLLKNGDAAVKDESMLDTLKDIINYAVLLQAKRASRIQMHDAPYVPFMEYQAVPAEFKNG